MLGAAQQWCWKRMLLRCRIRNAPSICKHGKKLAERTSNMGRESNWFLADI